MKRIKNMLSQLKQQVTRLKDKSSQLYRFVFHRLHQFILYLPHELYVEAKTNGYIKDVIERKINKTISYPHVKSIHISQITASLYRIVIKTTDSIVYNDIKALFANYKELLAPWIAFPDMFQGSPRWNQGYEEDYCRNYWIPYWKSMTEEEKNAYYLRHNAPQEWIDWLNTNFSSK